MLQESLHGREILAALAVQDFLLTGSEDTTFKVLDSSLKVVQSFDQHEASVRAFAKCRHKLSGEQIVVSAGSKMQAHVFFFSKGRLSHICKYQQQVFRSRINRSGTLKKEFSVQTET